MNHTKNYKRYLIENVEMCKRTRQRRERGDMPDEIYCSTNERMSSSSDDASDADLSNSESESDTSSCSTVADTQYIDEISDLSHDEMRDSEIDSFEELHDDRNTLYSEESNDQILENDENDDVESFEELNDECNTDSRKDFLYPGANITSEESEMLIMSYILRHGVSDKGLSDLLKLIDCHLPHSVLPSKYVFLKKFPDTMAPMYYRNANAAILMFDLTCYDSYESMKEWVTELRMRLEDPIIMCVIGNKSDMNDVRQVGFREASEYAISIGALYHEASALSSEGVEEVFLDISQEIIKQYEKNLNRMYQRDHFQGGKIIKVTESPHAVLNESEEERSFLCC